MHASDVQDYKKIIVAGFTVLVGLVVLLFESLYRDVLISYIKLVFTGEYSYLIIVLFSVITLFHYLIRDLGLSYEVRISKILTSILLISLSLVFYVLMFLDIEYSVQYGSVSLILIILSLIILVYNPVSMKDLIPLLTLFTLVPLPASLTDSITPYLSRFIGKLAALLTNTVFVESPAYARLLIETPSGLTSFDVEVACSGVIILSSIIAVVPVITYLVVFGQHDLRRKLVGIFTSLLLATLIGLLGSLLRVVLVVWGSVNYGIEAGVKYIHYTPSVIYSVFSVLLAFLIINRYVGLRLTIPKLILRKVNVELGHVIGVLTLLMIFTSGYVITLSSVVVSGLESVSSGNSLFIDLTELSDFIYDSPKYVFRASKDLRLIRYSYNSYLTSVLCAFRVYEILVEREGNYTYTGYVEVAENPGRFRTLWLCLTLQEFKVVNSWSKFVKGTRLYFVEVEKGELRGVLGYVLIPVTTNTSEEVVAYVRVSLMKLTKEASMNVVINEVEEGLSSIIINDNDSTQKLENILYWSILTSQALILLLVTYLLVISLPELNVFIRNVLKSVRRWLRVESWNSRKRNRS